MLQGVDELEQESAVAIHRAAHITDQHDPRLTNFARLVRQLNDGSAVLHVLPYGSPCVDDVTALRGTRPSALARCQLVSNDDDSAGNVAHLVCPKLTEVFAAQNLNGAVERERILVIAIIR